MQQEAISSCAINSFVGEETNAHPMTTSLQAVLRECSATLPWYLFWFFSPFTTVMVAAPKGCSPPWEVVWEKNGAKMLWPFFWIKLSKLNQFFPCTKRFMWHLLNSCSEVVLWRTDLCFHWGKTVKSLESSARGCNTVRQLKSLEKVFSFTESLLRRSFEVRDSWRSMLSCFIQNFIPYSKIQHFIRNFPWSHQL